MTSPRPLHATLPLLLVLVCGGCATGPAPRVANGGVPSASGASAGVIVDRADGLVRIASAGVTLKDPGPAYGRSPVIEDVMLRSYRETGVEPTVVCALRDDATATVLTVAVLPVDGTSLGWISGYHEGERSEVEGRGAEVIAAAVDEVSGVSWIAYEHDGQLTLSRAERLTVRGAPALLSTSGIGANAADLWSSLSLARTPEEREALEAEDDYRHPPSGAWLPHHPPGLHRDSVACAAEGCARYSASYSRPDAELAVSLYVVPVSPEATFATTFERMLSRMHPERMADTQGGTETLSDVEGTPAGRFFTGRGTLVVDREGEAQEIPVREELHVFEHAGWLNAYRVTYDLSIADAPATVERFIRTVGWPTHPPGPR